MNLLYGLIVVFTISGFFIAGASAQTYKMYVNKMPHSWEKQFGHVLDDAVKYWQQKIPGLSLQTVPYSDQSDFVVEWGSQFDSGKLGYYTTDTKNHYDKPKLTITLGYYKDKKWNLVSSDYALEITKHELGHAIGLPYSSDPNDIMYPQIESYESWSAARTITKTVAENQTKPGDWKAKATTYQTLSDKKLYQEKTTIEILSPYVNSTYTTNKGSQTQMLRAQDLLFEIKKFLNDAELSQSDADKLFYDGKYQDAYYKYKSSLDRAKQIDSKLIDIKKFLKKTSQLETGK